MREALYAKFTQHPDLGALLLSTGEALLVEHTSHDRYWADGGDGSGLTRLGCLWMELREILRRTATAGGEALGSLNYSYPARSTGF